MALKTYGFDTGPDGATLTPGNTGATTITRSGASTATFDAATKQSGPFAARFVNDGSGQSMAVCPADAANKVMAFEGNFIVTSIGSSSVNIVSFYNTSAAAQLVVTVTAARALQVSKSNGSAWTTILSNGNVTLGQEYRVAVLMSVDTTTTGHYSVNVYEGSSTTPLNPSPITSTTFDLGTAAIASGYVGCTSWTAVADVSWDAVRFNDGGTAEIGPPVVAASTTYPASSTTTATTTARGAITALLLASVAVAGISGTSTAADRVPRTFAASSTTAVTSGTSAAATAALSSSSTTAAVSATTTAAGRVTRAFPVSLVATAVSATSTAVSVIGGPATLPASSRTAAVSSTATDALVILKASSVTNTTSSTATDTGVIVAPVTWPASSITAAVSGARTAATIYGEPTTPDLTITAGALRTDRAAGTLSAPTTTGALR